MGPSPAALTCSGGCLRLGPNTLPSSSGRIIDRARPLVPSPTLEPLSLWGPHCPPCPEYPTATLQAVGSPGTQLLLPTGPCSQQPVEGPGPTSLPAMVLSGPDTWAPVLRSCQGEGHLSVLPVTLGGHLPPVRALEYYSRQRGQCPVGQWPAHLQGFWEGEVADPAQGSWEMHRKPTGVRVAGAPPVQMSPWPSVALSLTPLHHPCTSLSICVPWAVTEGTSKGLQSCVCVLCDVGCHLRAVHTSWGLDMNPHAVGREALAPSHRPYHWPRCVCVCVRCCSHLASPAGPLG